MAFTREQKAKFTKLEKTTQRDKKLEKGWKVWPTTPGRSLSPSPTPQSRIEVNSQTELSIEQKAKIAQKEKAAQRDKKQEKGWKVLPTTLPSTTSRSPSRSPTPRGRAEISSQRNQQRGISPTGRSLREVGALAAGLGAGARSTEEQAYSTEYGGSFRRQDIEEAWAPPSFNREPSTPRSPTPSRSLTPNRMPPEILPPAGKPSGFMERFVGSPRSRPCPRGLDCPYYSCPLAHPPDRLCPKGEDCTNPNCDFIHPQASPFSPFSNSGFGTPAQLASIGYSAHQSQSTQLHPPAAQNRERRSREDSPPEPYLLSRSRGSSPEIPIVDAIGARVLMTSRETWADDFVALWEDWAEATSVALREGYEVPAPPAPPALPKGRDAEVPPHLLARLTQAATFAAAFLAKGAASNKELRRAAGKLEEELIHTKEDQERLEDLVGMLAAAKESGALEEGRRVHGVSLWTPPAIGGGSAPHYDTGSPHNRPRGRPMTPEHENRLRGIMERRRSDSNSPDGHQPSADNSDALATRCTCGNTLLPDEAFCRRCGRSRQGPQWPEVLTRDEGESDKMPRELQRLQAALRNTEADKLELIDELRRLQNLAPNPMMRSGAADILHQKNLPHTGTGDRYQAPPGRNDEIEDDYDELGAWGEPPPPPPNRLAPKPPQQAKGSASRPTQQLKRGFEFSDEEDDTGPGPIRGLRDFRRGLSLESLSSDSEEDLLLSSRGNTRGNFNSKGGVMSALRRFDEEVLSLCHALGNVGPARTRHKDLKARGDRHLRTHDRDRLQIGGSRNSRDTPGKADRRISDNNSNTLGPRDIRNVSNETAARPNQLDFEEGRGSRTDQDRRLHRTGSRNSGLGQTVGRQSNGSPLDLLQDGRKKQYESPARSVDEVYDGVGREREHNPSRSHTGKDTYRDPESYDSAYEYKDPAYYNPNPYLERNPGRNRPGRQAPGAFSDQSVAGWAAAERRRHLWSARSD